MTIAPENVLPRQNDLLIRDMNINTKADNTRERHAHRNRSNLLSIVGFDEFCFSKVEEYNCFLNVAHAHRLVVLIEDEHFAAEFSGRAGYVM